MLKKMTKIILDESIYPRVNFDPDTIERYSEAMAAGAKFPLLVLTPDNRLLDGRYRLEAYKQAGVTEVKVTIENPADPAARAAELNLRHGKPLTKGEMKELARKWYGYDKDQPNRYIHNEREIFVGKGLGNKYGTFWRSSTRGLHRVKTPAMPMVASREEAQKNLDDWARGKGLKLLCPDPNNCESLNLKKRQRLLFTRGKGRGRVGGSLSYDGRLQGRRQAASKCAVWKRR